MASSGSLPPILGPGRHRQLLVLVLVGVVIAVAAGLETVLIRRLIRSDPSAERWQVGAGLLCMTIAVTCAHLAQRRAASSMGNAYVHDVRRVVIGKLASVDPLALRGRSPSTAALRLSADQAPLRRWASSGVAELVVAGAVAPIVVGWLIVLNPTAALAIVAGTSLGLIAAGAWCTRLGPSITEVRRQRGRIVAAATEVTSSLATIRAMGGARREARRLDQISSDLADAGVRFDVAAEWARQLAGLGFNLGRIAALIIVSGGPEGVSTGAALLIGTQVLARPVRGCAQACVVIAATAVARRKLAEFLLLPDVHASQDEVGIPGVMVCAVREADGERHRIDVMAGQRRVVSTAHPLASVLSALATFEPIEGWNVETCVIAGLDPRHARQRQWRRSVGIFDRRLALLRGSVLRNCRYRAPGADAAVVRSMLDAFGAAEVDFDRRVGDRGSHLTETERAAVQLVRALAGPPEVLILTRPEDQLTQPAIESLVHWLQDYPGTVLAVSDDARLSVLDPAAAA